MQYTFHDYAPLAYWSLVLLWGLVFLIFLARPREDGLRWISRVS